MGGFTIERDRAIPFPQTVSAKRSEFRWQNGLVHLCESEYSFKYRQAAFAGESKHAIRYPVPRSGLSSPLFPLSPFLFFSFFQI